MSLHADLLEQASQLARRDPSRPKQASLRRAVSTAYYALFHLLTSEASALYALDFELAARINRMMNHADLKRASFIFVNNRLPKGLRPLEGDYQIPAELKVVAEAVIRLQEARHVADYDLERAYLRHEVLTLIQKTRDAFDAWEKVRKTDDARLYLACFLLWKRFDEEPRPSAQASP